MWDFVSVIYLEHFMMTVLSQSEVCSLTCITAPVAWMPIFSKEEKKKFTTK